jgi:hypothetical protein
MHLKLACRQRSRLEPIDRETLAASLKMDTFVRGLRLRAARLKPQAGSMALSLSRCEHAFRRRHEFRPHGILDELRDNCVDLPERLLVEAPAEHIFNPVQL